MIENLLALVGEFHRSRPTVPEFPMMVEVLDALDHAVVPDRLPAADQLPAVRHLDQVQATGHGQADAIVAELVRLAPVLPWSQTTGYLSVLSQDYLDNYGYVRLIGPDSIVPHPSVRVGIGLWGPNLDYPLHEHEAEELYHVLAGSPTFAGDELVYRPAAVGEAIHHKPWQRHAQRFGPEPTLLLYCWTGAVGPDAVLVDPPS